MKVWSMVLALVAAFAFVSGLHAEDKEAKESKTVTLKGTITCAKCDLKEADKCHTVIKVTKDGKDTVYYFDDKSGKENHKKICTSPMEGTVTGTVSEKDGKMVVKVKKVTFAE